MSDFFDKEDIFDERESFFDEEDISPDPPEETPSVGIGESIGRGGVQGITSGFADEIGGALTSPLDWISEVSREGKEESGLKEVDDKLISTLLNRYKELSAEGNVEKADKFKKRIELESGQPFEAEKATGFWDIYGDRRDAAREANLAAKEANPLSYMGGEIAGGLAPALMSGGASAAATTGKLGLNQAALLGVKSGAKFGGAYGLGASEADLTEGEFGQAAIDTAVGAGTGAVMGGALPYVGAGIKLGAKGTKSVSDKLAKYTYDKAPSFAKKIIDATRRGSQKIQVTGSKWGTAAIQKMNELSDEVLQTVRGMGKSSTDEITEALVESGSTGNIKVMVDDLQTMVNNAKSSALDDEGAKTVKFFEDILDDVKDLSMKKVPSKRVKNLKSIDEVDELLEAKRQDIIAKRMLLPQEEKVTEKAINKLAKKDIEYENVMASPERAEFANLQREADIINFEAPKGDKVKSVLREVVPSDEVGPIEQIINPNGTIHRGFKVPGKEPVTMEVRPEIPYGQKDVSLQDLFNIQKKMKEGIPQQSPLTSELSEIQKLFKETILNRLPKNARDKVASGYKNWESVHATSDALSLPLKQGRGADTTTVETLKNKLGRLSEYTANETTENQYSIQEGLKFLAEIDPAFSKSVGDRAKEYSKRIVLAGEDVGGSVSGSSTGILSSAGIYVGDVIGKGAGLIAEVPKIFTSLPKNVLVGLSKIAEKDGKIKIANFLSNLATKGPQGRAAAMFSVMQNPATKKELMEVLNITEEARIKP